MAGEPVGEVDRAARPAQSTNQEASVQDTRQADVAHAHTQYT